MSPRLPGARASAGFVLFVHLALSPVVFSYATFEHFEFNKAALLLLAGLALVALGAVRVSPRSVGREPLVLGVLLFTGSAIASTLGSLSRWTSLVGASDSWAGLPTVLACVGLFFATRFLCRTPEAAGGLLLAPVLGAAVAATYAALQLLGLEPMPWTRAASFEGAVRPFATLAHPNFLGAYLAMVLPLVAVLGLRARGLARVPFALTGALSVLALVASLSRAAWAALALVLLILVPGAAWLGRRRVRARWGAALVLGSGAVAALLWRAWPGSGEFPSLIAERARHITDPGARQFIWRAAWRIFLEHPLLGSGLETFALAFQRHREPAYWLLEWNTTPYRAHSDVLHVLATQGLLGAGAVLVMLVGLGLAGRRAWRRARQEDRPLLLALFAGLVAFGVQGLVGFTVTATGVLFFTFAGVLSALGANAEQEEHAPAWPVAPALWSSGALAWLVLAFNFLGAPWSQEEESPGALSALMVLAGALGGVLFGALKAVPSSSAPTATATVTGPRRAWVRAAAWVVALAGAYVLVLRPYRASQLAQAGELLLASSPEQAAATFERAATLDPSRDLYFVRRGVALQRAAALTSEPTERTRRLSRALESLQRAISLVPADARHRARLGAMLTEFAALGVASPTQVYAAFDAALARDPHEANFLVQAANAALRLEDSASARRYASRAVELHPHFGPPRAQLGYLALTEGRPEEASQLLRAALEGEWHGDTSAWVAASGNLAAALLELGRSEQARQAASAAVEEAPRSTQARLVLGRLLEQVGAREEALVQYRHILTLEPDHAPAREALRRLGGEAGAR